MDSVRKVKKYLLIGTIIGGIASLSISLLMDSIYADAFQGTWRDAISKDLQTFFSFTASPQGILVNSVFVFVLAILTAFGGFMGFVFSFFLYKFFSFLRNK